MTNNGFSFGANEKYWARVTSPEYQAEKRAREAAERAEAERQAEQQRAEWQRQAVMSAPGPAILDTIQGYLDRNMPARSDKVEADFVKRLPGATPQDFRNALEYLKQAGQVHELVASTQGFMGERTTHLYPLEG